MSGILLFVSVLIFLCYAALLLYYRSGWVQLEEHLTDKQHEPKTKVSIIIPARNEGKNMALLLKDIMSQFYPTPLMEVIVVDDHSEDDTAMKVREFPGVKLLSLRDIIGNQKLNAYKKRAIEEGIKHSSGELIITTDADCRMHAYWLLSIVQFYEQGNYQLMAGPVKYEESYRWFNVFQSLDFMTMQGITGATSFHRSGSMCNGANLAYTRMAFDAVQGFRGIDDVASGDDMMLMNKIEKRFPGRTAYLKNKEAIVLTQPMPGIKAFFHQRIRWASKATRLNDKRVQRVLYFVYFFNLWFMFLLIFSLFKGWYLMMFFGMIACKTSIEAFFLYPVSEFFSKRKEIGWFYILQFIHIPYIIFSGLLGQMGEYEWKERRVS